MSLSLYCFNTLSNDEKKTLLEEYGTYIAFAPNEKKIQSLYKYSGYYVDVISDKETLEYIEITPFKQGVRLEKYLATIELKGL